MTRCVRTLQILRFWRRASGSTTIPFPRGTALQKICLGVIRRTIRDQARTLDHLPCGAGRNPGNIRTVGWNKWYFEHHIVQQCFKRRIHFVAFAPSVHVHNEPLSRNGDASCRADVRTAPKYLRAVLDHDARSNQRQSWFEVRFKSQTKNRSARRIDGKLPVKRFEPFRTGARSPGVACMAGSPRGLPATSCLLPRHCDADSFLRRDQVVDALGVLGNGELHALHATRKLVPSGPIVR